MRHTFATLQLTAGTNSTVVSEMLSHKEVAELERLLRRYPGDI